MAQFGADPGQVIDHMANMLGEQAKNLAIANVVIASQEQEIVKLRAQLAATPTAD